jgi:hypothetical protein
MIVDNILSLKFISPKVLSVILLVVIVVPEIDANVDILLEEVSFHTPSSLTYN